MSIFDYLDTQAKILDSKDKEFFDSCFIGYPGHPAVDDLGNVIPCSLGPHSIPPLRRFVEEVKPQKLLQVGFNVGASTCILFKLGVPRITSVEIRDSSEVHASDKYVNTIGEHRLIISDSTKMAPGFDVFDAAFIDGDHGIEAVRSDLELAKSCGVIHVLMDDMLPQYGTGFQAASERMDTKMLWWDGNIAAFKFL